MKFMILVKATKDTKDGQKSFVDGPFAETKELVAGYTIIDVKSREEAIAWTKRRTTPTKTSNRGAPQ